MSSAEAKWEGEPDLVGCEPHAPDQKQREAQQNEAGRREGPHGKRTNLLGEA